MGKFDTIDIFFIAIIGAYFITLMCIIITIVYLSLSKALKNIFSKDKTNAIKPIIDVELPEEEPIIPKEKSSNKAFAYFKKLFAKKEKTHEKIPLKKLSEEPKEIKPKKQFKFSNIPLIRKLFMVEVPKEPKEYDKMDATNMSEVNIIPTITEEKEVERVENIEKIEIKQDLPQEENKNTSKLEPTPKTTPTSKTKNKTSKSKTNNKSSKTTNTKQTKPTSNKPSSAKKTNQAKKTASTQPKKKNKNQKTNSKNQSKTPAKKKKSKSSQNKNH